MSLLYFNKNTKVDSIGYETVYLEKPMSSLIDFDWKNILNAPPKNSSQTTIKELKLIAESTQKRSKKDIQLIHNVDQDLDFPFTSLLRKYKLLYPENYIKLFYDIVYPVLMNTKKYWNRPRPIQLAEFYNIDINVVYTDTHHTAAYPSGHTVYSKLVANILKYIYPELPQKELDNIVLETARARVIQGVHYPTDNKASIIFSNFLFNTLNPKLRKYHDQIQ
jgi:hypothetical protein